jgi:hypothetical protein
MDIYQSARLISASGTLQKNKGIMLLGASSGILVKMTGLSGGNRVVSSVGVTGVANDIRIIPVQIIGITLGASGTVYELN